MTHDPLQVQFDLRRRGWTQAALALQLGVGRPLVSKVITGKERSERIEKAIEKIINWNPWKGIPVKRRGRKDADRTDQ